MHGAVLHSHPEKSNAPTQAKSFTIVCSSGIVGSRHPFADAKPLPLSASRKLVNAVPFSAVMRLASHCCCAVGSASAGVDASDTMVITLYRFFIVAPLLFLRFDRGHHCSKQ